jgi:CO dehydrogenase/acetyl-CoA synthase alpha subunit
MVSRTVDTTSERERGAKQMNICQFCGWEVRQVDWYNFYNQKPICDNCVMDTMSKRERESSE